MWVSTKHTHSLWLIYLPGLSQSHTHPTITTSSVCVCVLQVERTSRPDLVLFLIKYLMMLIVGIPSVFWVGSKKTCFEWASFFHGKRRKEYVLHPGCTPSSRLYTVLKQLHTNCFQINIWVTNIFDFVPVVLTEAEALCSDNSIFNFIIYQFIATGNKTITDKFMYTVTYMQFCVFHWIYFGFQIDSTSEPSWSLLILSDIIT